ncbi:uncharacterized protein BCR38DRAFT_471849 [Pseudomassariella vexata]|uniref:Uncharacterized protein n=1 Tax=Pseudomassariella vexata TaxID=1141098 RepID=A0A1Y2E9L8_9PEZI|nr:uncharacterized protein BCR38DRAFT_471849 [Pseudomassariella vexata]ORY68239.1 hypothetical protein BCR38DRAFT_471849 [Pseudomassariella vexata]
MRKHTVLYVQGLHLVVRGTGSIIQRVRIGHVRNTIAVQAIQPPSRVRLFLRYLTLINVVFFNYVMVQITQFLSSYKEPTTFHPSRAMMSLLRLYLLVLAIFIATALAVPAVPAVPELAPWGPTAVWYYRCSSSSQVETSWNLKDWRPSAVCRMGTCCSNLAPSPLCTIEACDLVPVEIKQGGTRLSG